MIGLCARWMLSRAKATATSRSAERKPVMDVEPGAADRLPVVWQKQAAFQSGTSRS
jgi:hypothetical protein